MHIALGIKGGLERACDTKYLFTQELPRGLLGV